MNPSAWTLLALTLLALAAGPLAYGAARASGRLTAFLDGFLFVGVGGFVLLQMVPASAAVAGWAPAAAAVAAGLWLPALIGRYLPPLKSTVRVVALLLALAAIGAHACLDGLALSGGAGGGDWHAAGLLHRLPLGLALWFLLRPLYGPAPALAALGAVAAATAAGFLGLIPGGAAPAGLAWGLFQALTAGALLHVVLRRRYPVAAAEDAALRRWPSGLGALAALVLLGVVTAAQGVPGVLGGMAGVFYTLARESAPALLIAYVGAGLVYALLPQGTVDWMRRGSRLSQAARGMAFGLPLPVCSCGVVPLYRSIVVAGVPPTAAMAFLIATPELSLDAVLITLPLLGGEFTVARVAAAAAVALGTGWFVGRFASRLVPRGAAADAGAGKAPLTARLRTGLSQGLGEVVDSTAPWILVGLTLAALVHGLVGTRWSELVPPGLEVEIMALVGMPVYVCAAGATPLVAVLVLNGVSPGAALAFLITGPATNVTTLGVLTRLHGRRIALLFAACVVVITVLLGRAVNGLTEVAGVVPDLEHAGHGAGWRDLCLAALGALMLASMVRRGPRAFVGEILEAGAAEPAGEAAHSCCESEPEPDCCGGASEPEPDCCGAPSEPEPEAGCCGASTAALETGDRERAST